MELTLADVKLPPLQRKPSGQETHLLNEGGSNYNRTLHRATDADEKQGTPQNKINKLPGTQKTRNGKDTQHDRYACSVDILRRGAKPRSGWDTPETSEVPG